MTEAAKEAVRSIAQNFSQVDSSHLSDTASHTNHAEKLNKFVDSIPEVSTMVNVVTEKADGSPGTVSGSHRRLSWVYVRETLV